MSAASRLSLHTSTIRPTLHMGISIHPSYVPHIIIDIQHVTLTLDNNSANKLRLNHAFITVTHLHTTTTRLIPAIYLIMTIHYYITPLSHCLCHTHTLALHHYMLMTNLESIIMIIYHAFMSHICTPPPPHINAF